MFHGCTPLPSSGSLGKLWWVALAKWLLDVSWSHALSLSWPKSLWSDFWMFYSSLQQKAWSWARTPYGVEVYLTVFLLKLPWTTNDLISHEKYLCCCCTVSQSCLTLQPHGLQPARFLHPWDFPGKNTGVGCHSLLQGIFLTQRLNSGILH